MDKVGRSLQSKDAKSQLEHVLECEYKAVLHAVLCMRGIVGAAFVYLPPKAAFPSELLKAVLLLRVDPKDHLYIVVAKANSAATASVKEYVDLLNDEELNTDDAKLDVFFSHVKHLHRLCGIDHAPSASAVLSDDEEDDHERAVLKFRLTGLPYQPFVMTQVVVIHDEARLVAAAEATCSDVATALESPCVIEFSPRYPDKTPKQRSLAAADSNNKAAESAAFKNAQALVASATHAAAKDASFCNLHHLATTYDIALVFLDVCKATFVKRLPGAESDAKTQEIIARTAKQDLGLCLWSSPNRDGFWILHGPLDGADTDNLKKIGEETHAFYVATASGHMLRVMRSCRGSSCSKTQLHLLLRQCVEATDAIQGLVYGVTAMECIVRLQK